MLKKLSVLKIIIIYFLNIYKFVLVNSRLFIDECIQFQTSETIITLNQISSNMEYSIICSIKYKYHQKHYEGFSKPHCKISNYYILVLE